ncbi:MAG: hypothetical protein HY832_01095 [Candidatus Aenigmarchaeota archaeon]|nr:hypothetical protein [Candidatus Aenigmarchaeota archaeon]
MPILTEHERKVLEIVIRDKKVDQRKVVKETDFSKAKVSRIVQDLLLRGVLEKVRKGRTNILTLKTAKIGTLTAKKQPEENKYKNMK